MSHEDALTQLGALLGVPGALQIITNERADEDMDPKSPRAWVCHAVTEIEGPDAKGRLVAHSAEGDWCVGYPADLLRRLTEAGRAE